MNGSTLVPADVLEELKGKDIVLVLDMGDDVFWSIDGKEITEENISDIDLEEKTEKDFLKKIEGTDSSIETEENEKELSETEDEKENQESRNGFGIWLLLLLIVIACITGYIVMKKKEKK